MGSSLSVFAFSIAKELIVKYWPDRYDVELFQKIEALTGQKMEKFEAEQDAALILLDGVNEAQRVATMQVYLDQSSPHLQPTLMIA